jgi:hypothetical protein
MTGRLVDSMEEADGGAVAGFGLGIATSIVLAWLLYRRSTSPASSPGPAPA